MAGPPKPSCFKSYYSRPKGEIIYIICIYHALLFRDLKDAIEAERYWEKYLSDNDTVVARTFQVWQICSNIQQASSLTYCSTYVLL